MRVKRLTIKWASPWDTGGESPRSRVLIAGCVQPNAKVQTVFVAMFIRYPRAVLRHKFDHSGRNTLTKTMLTPQKSFGNNAGMGPPATASRGTEVGPSASWEEAVTVEQEVAKPLGPGVRPLKGFTRRELRERLSKQRVKGAVMQPSMAQAVEQLSTTTDRAEWEFPRTTHSSWPKGIPSRFGQEDQEPRHKSSGGGEGRRRIRG